MSVDAVRKKEQEWRDAVDAKLRATQDAVKSRESRIKQLQEQLATLEADFRYNLALLADRDADLERFESTNERLKASLEKKTELANCMKIKLEDAKIASRLNFLEYEDRRHLAEKSLAEKDASLNELKRQLESTSTQYNQQIELERENSQRRLLDLANDAGRRCSRLKNQYMSAISHKDAELAAAVAESDARVKVEEGRVTRLHQELQDSKNQVQRLQASLVALQNEIKEHQAKCARETDAQLGVAASRLKELESSQDEARKETNALRLEVGNMKVKLAEANNKIAERDRILTMMGKGNLTLEEKNLGKGEEFEQLKKQNEVLRCVIKEMKKKMRGDSAFEETDLKKNATNGDENDVDDQRVSQLENTLGLLKMQMCQNLRDKLTSRETGSVEPKDPNFGDVRILLLEQKLDKATENIGKTVALEKKELLDEMKNVRKEIASKLTSENIFRNSLVVSKDILKSDQILEGVRKDILRLESKIGKISRENDIETVERERVERGVGVQSLMRHDIVTRHEAKGHRRVDSSDVFYLPIPPMQIQGTAINSSRLARKVAIQEKKVTHTRLRNYNVRDEVVL